jgi:three-Cys-motif partner protein
MADSEFFSSPEQQSIVKTELVTKYFGAWSKMMLSRSKNLNASIAYIDLFSGPGRFNDGSDSTPLWVLKNAIEDPKLQSRLRTIFNDQDASSVERLETAIDELPDVNTLAHKPRVTNFVVGSDLVDSISHLNLVPTLFFIDPWGYKGLSLRLLGRAIKSWGCDCIFFFNYNRINAGINNGAVKDHMDELFGLTRADNLRTKVRGLSPRHR